MKENRRTKRESNLCVEFLIQLCRFFCSCGAQWQRRKMTLKKICKSWHYTHSENEYTHSESVTRWKEERLEKCERVRRFESISRPNLKMRIQKSYVTTYAYTMFMLFIPLLLFFNWKAMTFFACVCLVLLFLSFFFLSECKRFSIVFSKNRMRAHKGCHFEWCTHNNRVFSFSDKRFLSVFFSRSVSSCCCFICVCFFLLREWYTLQMAFCKGLPRKHKLF